MSKIKVEVKKLNDNYYLSYKGSIGGFCDQKISDFIGKELRDYRGIIQTNYYGEHNGSGDTMVFENEKNAQDAAEWIESFAVMDSLSDKINE